MTTCPEKHIVRRRQKGGFTLTELLVVLGLIFILVSLLLPVLAKVRAAASAAKCSSNLHQLGLAWSMYVSANKGRVPEYLFYTPQTPDVAWHGYWLGIMDQYKVSGQSLICPTAYEPTGIATSRGYGDAMHEWTGKYASNGSVVRLSHTMYREGSYGYNRFLTAGGGFAGSATQMVALHDMARVPLFMDCVYVDTAPNNQSADDPVSAPPDLTGGKVTPGSPDHWKFLIARHGRGINVCMADGAVSWVPLEETYMLSWKNGWVMYSLSLPPM